VQRDQVTILHSHMGDGICIIALLHPEELDINLRSNICSLLAECISMV
jgi:hypothetical protein